MVATVEEKKGKSFSFEVLAKDPYGKAKAGLITTAHGSFPTPMFMPVGTRGTVKGMAPDDLKSVGAKIVLANTFHLMLRPGEELIKQLGGLHKFMAWDGPILTDSGGFQVFSLTKLRKLSEEGVTFNSPYDGNETFLSPERSIEVQTALGVDIMMCFDECTPYPASYQDVEKSLDLTLRWAKRSQNAQSQETDQALFAIVQGGFYPDLKKRSAETLVDMDFVGYAVGGLSLGEPWEVTMEAVELARSILPENKPMYLMGMGTPKDLVESIKRGADMFDCVMPTRHARNGQLFTSFGRLVIKNSRFKDDPKPLEEGCGCYTCCNFSRAYLRHLFKNGEPLALRLATWHNLYYYLSLMENARKAILEGSFSEFYKNFHFNQSRGLN